MIRAAVFGMALLAQGCCIAPGFVKAQRAYHDAISLEYRQYVAADPNLSEEDKASRYDMLAAEEAVLAEAEAE